MDKSVVQVEVKNVLATSAGSAIFLGNEEKELKTKMKKVIDARGLSCPPRALNIFRLTHVR